MSGTGHQTWPNGPARPRAKPTQQMTPMHRDSDWRTGQVFGQQSCTPWMETSQGNFYKEPKGQSYLNMREPNLYIECIPDRLIIIRCIPSNQVLLWM